MTNPKNQTAALVARDSESLLEWYMSVRRDLPWRASRDPYRIWISEVMLQQTTVTAVIPYYERFMARFPTLPRLAEAPVEEVLEMWAGLGYYSRARNLHKSAQALHENLKRGVHKSGFPPTYLELIEFPGFGPYTARAVASLAFGEKTGVLDGNVIRILSRRYGLAVEWWKPKERDRLQELADRLAQVENPSDLNQAMMELGATVCTPKSPACMLCPWMKQCEARKLGKVMELPLPKPRRAREIWIWHPQVVVKAGKVLLIENSYAPFLKGHWILPGRVEKKPQAPKDFDFRGSVTHHDIFVSLKTAPKVSVKGDQARWIKIESMKKEIPASLIRKAIDFSQMNRQMSRQTSRQIGRQVGRKVNQQANRK